MVPMNTNAAPVHIMAFAWRPYTATLRSSETALRTVKMRVTVSDDTRPVSLLTPMTHNNCVAVFAKRYKNMLGSASAGLSRVFARYASTSGTDARATLGLVLRRASSVAMVSREK